MKNIIKLRIFLWLCLMVLVFCILYTGIVPNGKISYEYLFNEKNKFFGKISPQERVGFLDKDKIKITGDPVYFSLRTLRNFDKAKFIIEYENFSDFSVIETGVLADSSQWRYELKPVENKIIDQLSLVWNVFYEDDVLFLQKEKKYENINNFLNNMPDRREIALYNYDFKDNYVIKDYQKSKGVIEEKNIPALVGGYQFWTYIKDEILDFKFIFTDLEENKKDDFVEIILYYNDKIIYTQSLEYISKNKDLDFKVENLPEGIYKLELRASEDIITKKIFSSQNKISFLNNINLYKENKENIKIFTDGKVIYAKTSNPDSLQSIKIGEDKLEIKETYRQFKVEVDNFSFTEINLEKDGIILASDGIFSFSEEEAVNPSLKKINSNIDLKKENINYILANYKSPQKKEKRKIAEIEFDLKNKYKEKGKYGFIISVPGLLADDGINDYVSIYKIRIELEGKDLWQKIKNKFFK